MTLTIQNPAAIAQNLEAVIGSRPIGSLRNQAVAEMFSARFQDAGLHVEQIPYRCPTWACDHAALTANGRSFPVLPNPFSPSGSVAAPLSLCTHSQQLSDQDYSQHILAISGNLVAQPLGNRDNPVYIPEETRTILAQLEAAAPLGVIAISPHNELLAPLIEDWTFAIPSVTVSRDVGLELLQVAGPLRLEIEAETTQGTAVHVLGRTTPDPHATRVVVTAHFDSKYGTPAAWDNGSGSAVLLALAEQLPQLNLPFEVEFVAFNGEEYAQGSDVFLARYGLEPIPVGSFWTPVETPFSQIKLAINIDGVGQKLAVDTLTSFGGEAELSAAVTQTLDAFPELISIDPWFASNHYDFLSHNIPCVALTSQGGAPILHTQSDTAAQLDNGRLARLVEALVDLLGKLSHT